VSFSDPLSFLRGGEDGEGRDGRRRRKRQQLTLSAGLALSLSRASYDSFLPLDSYRNPSPKLSHQCLTHLSLPTLSPFISIIRSGTSLFSPTPKIDLSTARSSSAYLDLDLDAEEDDAVAHHAVPATSNSTGGRLPRAGGGYRPVGDEEGEGEEPRKGVMGKDWKEDQRRAREAMGEEEEEVWDRLG
jgi:hypothetical protein